MNGPIWATPKEIKWLKMCLAGADIFSTCGKRQYFAAITDVNGHIIGTGYNGVPSGMRHCDLGGCPRLAENSASGSSYNNCYAIHAEANAIIHSDFQARQGGTLYINGTPCFDCGKAIANSGVTRVIYIEDPSYADWPRVKEMLTTVGIRTVGVDRDQL